MATCKLYNRWDWSIAKAGIMLDSPNGGCIWIPKGKFSQMKDVSDFERAVVMYCGQMQLAQIDLTMEQMQALLDVAKRVQGGIWRIGKLGVTNFNKI